MPGAVGATASCTRRICSTALNALMKGQQHAALAQPPAAHGGTMDEVQPLFASLGVRVDEDADGYQVHLQSMSLETAVGLLRMHQANYECDAGLSSAVGGLSRSMEQLSQLETSDPSYVRALFAANAADGALATFPLLHGEDWDLLDDMRRRVYAGDLALTDGWGAYLIVQAKFIPQASGKIGHAQRAVKRKRCREVATKNMDGWAEHHPDAAVVLGVSFTNLDGLEFVESAPNSAIIMAALQELAAERQLPAHVAPAASDANAQARSQPDQQQGQETQRNKRQTKQQHASDSTEPALSWEQAFAPDPASSQGTAGHSNTRAITGRPLGPGSIASSSAGAGMAGTEGRSFKEALDAHVSAGAPLVQHPASSLEALAQSVAARAQRLHLLDSLMVSMTTAVNQMRQETYQGLLHEQVMLAALQQRQAASARAMRQLACAQASGAPWGQCPNCDTEVTRFADGDRLLCSQCDTACGSLAGSAPVDGKQGMAGQGQSMPASGTGPSAAAARGGMAAAPGAVGTPASAPSAQPSHSGAVPGQASAGQAPPAVGASVSPEEDRGLVHRLLGLLNAPAHVNGAHGATGQAPQQGSGARRGASAQQQHRQQP